MFCKNCGKEISNSASFCKECGAIVQKEQHGSKKFLSFFKRHKKGLIILIIVILVVIWIDSTDTSNTDYQNYPVDNYSSQNNSTNNSGTRYNQDTIAASVVNILCLGAKDDFSDATGGSGTIVSTDGVVLTNSHIIPQDSDENSLGACLVILPDPTTGSADEMYLGTPIIVPYLSSLYDIAAIKIEEPYVDENGTLYGSYNKIFPAFDDANRCLDENVKLGEPVRIFGYPEISGGYSLTVTDGVVSSLPGDGTILTSAKVTSGNSGGLAIDQNGCMLGIPSMVVSDENENLGVIISTSLMNEFLDKLDALYKLLE